jgi:branched-chain amino acid transport system substrate-binding protein
MRRSFPPRFVRRVILFVSISLCLIAGGLAADPKQAPIEIGAVHNLTGAFGSIGGPSLRGAMLAVTKLNAQGGLLGRRVELVARDGRSDPTAVAAITREFVRMPGMSAITGLNDTTMALAAAPIAEKGRMVFLTSGATSPLVPLQFPGYYFMTCFGDNTQAAAGAEYAFGTLQAATAWLLFDDTTDYTVLLARYFRERYTELGGAIVGEDTYAGGTGDFSDQIARILALPTQPDLLYVSSGPDDIGRIVKQLREAGLHQPIVGGDGYDTPLLLQVAGAAADNTYFTTHTLLDPQQGTPAVRRFIADFEREYGAPPETGFAALGYDAVMLIANAIERAGSAKQKAIPGALEETEAFAGVTGAIEFGPLAHIPQKEVTVVRIVGTSLTLAAVIQPQKVPSPEIPAGLATARPADGRERGSSEDPARWRRRH